MKRRIAVLVEAVYDGFRVDELPYGLCWSIRRDELVERGPAEAVGRIDGPPGLLDEDLHERPVLHWLLQQVLEEVVWVGLPID